MGNTPTRKDLEYQIQKLEQQVAASSASAEKLNDLEEKYRILVENANDAIFVLQDGKVQFHNPKSSEIMGMIGSDIDGKKFTEFLHPDEKAKVVHRHKKRLNGQKVLSMYPLRLINQAGDIMWVEVNAVRINWAGKPATLNIIRDITSQKIVETKFSKTDNLTTLRTLAGGLAHELNNLLMGIQGRASLLSMGLGRANPLHMHIEQMEALINEAAKLSKQMVGFAQCGKYRLVKLDLNDIVDEALETIRRSSKAFTIERDFAPELWPVEADRGQIDQALVSILLNARQAIQEQGTISVKTENTVLREVRPHIESLKPGQYVKVSIKDSGIGMDDTIRKRVFEPFFSTKAIGRHRGLGLASAFGIVVNHGGMIDVTSAPAKGSTFIILLPVAKEEERD